MTRAGVSVFLTMNIEKKKEIHKVYLHFIVNKIDSISHNSVKIISRFIIDENKKCINLTTKKDIYNIYSFMFKDFMSYLNY